MNDEKNDAEPSGASGGSLANAHSARQDAEAKIIVDGIAEIMRIASEPDWIPVTERLPVEDVEVFAGCFTKQGTALFYAVAKWRKTPLGSYAWEDEDCVIHHPTHWMPLPAPPSDAR